MSASHKENDDTNKPCKVEYASHSVIENRLLARLEEDDSVVACLFTKQDCELLIEALHAHKNQMVLHDPWNDQWKKVAGMRDDLKQLVKAAFEK